MHGPPTTPPTRQRSETFDAGLQRSLWALEHWSDANKVLLISALTLPFALAWLVRSTVLQSDLVASPYVDRSFLSIHLPFLWLQVAGHTLLVLAAGLLRKRAPPKIPWLVHTEIQFWFLCMVYSLYVVGPFTSPFGVLVLALPIMGYQIFDQRSMHLGLITFLTGITLGAVLPQLGVLPYAPFLARPPFEQGKLQTSWIISLGLPSMFATTVVLLVHVSLMRRLHQRQEELERLSSTDFLTGLFNRSIFFRRLEEEVARARRHSYPLCVVMLDVDHFKAINDTLGHQAGDDVLRALGGRLQGAVRVDDVAARYGGEEFAVLLPYTSIKEAHTVAERLHHAAHEVKAGAAHITVSLGVAQLEPSDRGDDLVARADSALYDSKRNGRDRVTYAASTTQDAAAQHAKVQ